ncbi:MULTISPECIES: DsbA family protein [unclassified Halobacillus]|uniref:DsbA family protein n=1 Tax=unclassified Halobacillus TaxID=2636472 RepID=UPI0002A4F5D5|nr:MULTISPECIES: DsbA family protein [unclassified Halobacillus]ELK45994.1 thiol-disulfide oxidoreductase [Halobacillus sp. BAB-2008]
MKKPWIWMLVFLGIVVIAGIIGVYAATNSDDDTGSGDAPSADTYEGQPYLGDEDAEVKIVEFGDYKCPYCKDFTANTYPLIDKDLIQTGKAKFYFVNYPFIHEDSKRSAEFAEVVYQELGNETFWEFHDLLYEKQNPGEEQEEVYTEDYLVETLESIASEEEAQTVLEAYQNGEGEDAVERDLDLVKEWGVTSTPALFIDGERFEGSTHEDFVQAVEEAQGE